MISLRSLLSRQESSRRAVVGGRALGGLPAGRLLGVLGLALLANGACGPRAEVPAEALAIPEDGVVRIVRVSVLRADGTTRSDHQVDTVPRVRELLAVLRGHEHDPWKTMELPRPQELTVGFETADALPLILRIGPDWIGGFDTKRNDRGLLAGRWRPLGPGEHDRLLLALRPEDSSTPLRLDAQ